MCLHFFPFIYFILKRRLRFTLLLSKASHKPIQFNALFPNMQSYFEPRVANHFVNQNVNSLLFNTSFFPNKVTTLLTLQYHRESLKTVCYYAIYSHVYICVCYVHVPLYAKLIVMQQTSQPVQYTYDAKLHSNGNKWSNGTYIQKYLLLCYVPRNEKISFYI